MCGQFEKHIKQVRDLLSRNILYSMTCLAMEILILLFAIPSILINLITNGNAHPVAIVNMGSTLFYTLILVFYVYYFNIIAENVTDKIKNVKTSLKDVYVSAETMTDDFEGKPVPLSFVKSRIEDKLDNFQGFDGQGYFILGKSFLKNLLAFCITYFVILLQFKISEVSSDGSDPITTKNVTLLANITEL